MGTSCRFVLFVAVWASFVVIATADAKCDSLGVNFYEKIGCPKQADVDGCPSFTDCKYEIPSGKCLYNGETLSPGDTVTGDILCNWHCTCGRGYNPEDSRSQIVCAQGQCGIDSEPFQPHCYREYENLEQCCGRLNCDNKSTITCDVEGKTYKENEIFYPKHECYKCRCTKDFNGKFEEPACKRRGCDAEIHNVRDIENNCAPVYYKEDGATALCCPSTFMCPSDADKVTPASEESERSCKYGDKTYKLNTVIKGSIEQYGKTREVTCKCELPPLFTCTAEY